MAADDFATKQDLAKVETNLEGQIAALHTKIDLLALQMASKADIQALRSEIKAVGDNYHAMDTKIDRLMVVMAERV